MYFNVISGDPIRSIHMGPYPNVHLVPVACQCLRADIIGLPFNFQHANLGEPESA